MSREQGTFPFSANFEVKKKGTFDARQLVDRFEDLLAFTSANFIDTGFPVAVAKDSEYNGTSYLRGIYQCEDADNIDLESGWRNISSGGVAKDYDVAHYYEVDDLVNIAEENPTEDFLLVKDLELYYFGQKQTNVVDFKNCRLTIGKQAFKKDFEEDDIIKIVGGYTFWKLDAPLSLDLTSGGSEAAFVYDRKFTSASVNLVDSLTSTSTIEALTANQGRVLKGFIDAINTLLSSDDTTLDELQEIVEYIKQNKDDLQNLSISNIAGLVTALSTKLEKGNYTGTAEDLFLLIDNFQGFSGDYNDLINRLELGETSTTAGRGDHTKAAYDHSQEAHAPSDAQKNSNITKAEIEAKIDTYLKVIAQTLTEPQQKQVRDNINAAEKYSRIEVATSRNLLPSDNNKLLLITAPLTLTFSSSLPADFNFNHKILAGGQLTVTKGDSTLLATEGNSVSQLVFTEHSFGTSYQIAPNTNMMEGKLA